ncbi:hypothetical protein CC2G_012690 [Coprinopsis cinerea AmutBmut pab1-1]|nr:hypothetical protein CC2G_012690 [Coprinopsis cinerea AmutBmut pab1-1]
MISIEGRLRSEKLLNCLKLSHRSSITKRPTRRAYDPYHQSLISATVTPPSQTYETTIYQEATKRLMK